MDTETPTEITFSFVVPAFNVQEGLEDFYGRLKVAADAVGEVYEIIFVNDGSTDDTASVIGRFRETDPHVKLVDLSRRFGTAAAVMAGYDFAEGKAAISIEPGRHRPDVIAELVARWREGFEVVSAVAKRPAPTGRLSQWIAGASSRLLRGTDGAAPAAQGEFRLLDRKVVLAIRQQRQLGLPAAGLVQSMGFRRANVTAEPEGKVPAPLSLVCQCRKAMDNVFSHSLAPLRLAALIGAALLAISILYLLVALVLWPIGVAPSAPVTVGFALAGLFGVQFLLMGILGAYVGRVIEQGKIEPLYVVRETCGFPSAEEPQEDDAEDEEKEPEDKWVVYT